MRDTTPPRLPGGIVDGREDDAIDDGTFFDENEMVEILFDESIEDDYSDEEISEDVPQPLPNEDNSSLTFANHGKPVFSCAFHPLTEFTWAVTGGEDDKAYVWDFNLNEIIFEVTGHSDTVICSSFSHDGIYLATGDMAGEIQVFKTTNNFEKIWNYSMGDMTWMMWHKAAWVLFAGSELGDIYVWRLPSEDCKVLPGHQQNCEVAELTSDGKKIFAGYADGSIKLWDIKTCTVLYMMAPPNQCSHAARVTSVSCDMTRSLYLSGDTDGVLLASTINNSLKIMNTGECIETVAFCPETDISLAAVASTVGQLLIYDAEKWTIRCECEAIYNSDHIQVGFTCFKWVENKNLIVGTIEGDICIYDGRNGKLKSRLTGHSSHIYSMAYDSTRSILLTTSEDGTAKIFPITLS